MLISQLISLRSFNMNLKWDHYSDQPEVIRDRSLKKRIYKATRWASIKLLLTNLIAFPIVIVNYALSSKKTISVDISQFFAMSINLDKNPDKTRALIDDLGCNTLLIRVPLHDIENLQSYIEFAEQFSDKKILITILQDRRHVEDLAMLDESLIEIFLGFQHITRHFQIGNAINRKKWAFFSMDEYLKFYQVAQKLKERRFPELILLGSSVIDFEYYFTARTLFNRFDIKYDEFSSLLYVDRRGAPENTQMGLNLIKKLHLLQSMLRLSAKTSNEIVITETNWPIQNTAPYAPTSEKECVSLEEHANFLVRYYLLALTSGVVKNVYWHQLIAPGYGLIDNRGGQLIKYPAYYAFKTMISLLQETTFEGLTISGDLYQASFIDDSNKRVDVLWSVATSIILNTEDKEIILRDGERLKDQIEVTIQQSPTYLIS